MMKLDNFVGMMTGHFDNKDQFNKMQAEGKVYPYAEHVNTICNDKINNLPEDFKGKFVVEESFSEWNTKRFKYKSFVCLSSEDRLAYTFANEDVSTSFICDDSMFFFLRKDVVDIL